MSSEQNTSLAEGIRMLQAGNLPEARAKLTQAIQENASDGRAYGYLGIVLARLGDPMGGINALQEAVRLQPHDPGALYNLAVALVQVQRIADAKLALEHVLVMDPNHTKARAALQNLSSTTIQRPSQPNSSPYTAPPGAPVGTYVPAQPQPLDGSPGIGLGGGLSSPPHSAPGSYPPPGPGNYAPPPSPYGGSSYGGSPYGAPPPPGSGMQYTQAPMARHAAPSSGTRILRGLGWGFLYGQWWTLWNIFWGIVWGSFSTATSHSNIGGGSLVLVIVITSLVFAIVFGFVGAVAGLIIGASDSTVETGAIIGVVAGLLLCGLEFLLSQSGATVINIFFWFFTGRFVGTSIARKVHQPVGT